MSRLSIYIHWPFCAAKCPYCDFNSRPIASDLDETAWRDAYLREISAYATLLPVREITTIYFGGGTPSLMKPDTIAAILNKIAALWRVQHNVEITIEANPSSSEIGKFQAFKAEGVNRLSLGVQALNDVDLQFLGRTHDKNAAREAIESAQKIFDRFSFDLIYARKSQTPAAWEQELQHALSFGAQHMSLYQLTIEEGTVFYKRAVHETLQADEEASAIMFEQTQVMMESAGLPSYEISNYAAGGQESQHNLTYWHYDDYIGIGPGAHGRFVDGIERKATENHRRPDVWLQAVQQAGQGVFLCETLDSCTAQREALMMGLRLKTGIDHAVWQAKFASPLADFIDAAKVQHLIQQDLLRNSDTQLAATESGRQRLNAVLDFLLNEGK